MDRRQIKLLRSLLNIALVSLIVGAILNLLEGIFGTLYSLVLGLGTVAVTLYCFYRADRQINASTQYYLWRYVPTVLFIVVPLTLYLVSVWESSWSLEVLYLLAKLGSNYLIPIACLLFVERSLKRSTY